ncbi:hypothetical protein K440DRAFT_620106 [Wilcoxina mikolae CBS 423.85]|nr:hypothetical protein K440DRAFT_620106 [Wilcoxina mikolae CBS 423.85]
MRPTTYIKMGAACLACCIGGPALVMWVQPDPDELFKRYNCDLQRKALSQREQRLKDHAAHVAKLRKYCQSEKPIWIIAVEEENKRDRTISSERQQILDELERQKQEILAEQTTSSR